MSTPAVATAADSDSQLGHKQLLVVFSGLMLAMLLAALDQTIVATALPRIVGDLGGLDHLSWVVTAYLLTSTASTPLYGKISDLYGRKIIFQSAIVIFLVGSALSGLSQNMAQLIGFRAVQGLGAGGLMTLAMAIIGDVVSPRERGRYQGYFGAVFGLSSVAGPLLGGALTEHHHFLGLTTSWRWVFYINLPLGIAALVVIAAVLRIDFPRHDHKIDYLGAALMVTGVTSLLMVTVWGGKQGQGGYAWGSWQILTLLIAGLLLSVGFVVREHYASEPILPLRLFKNKIFSVANAITFVIGLGMFGAIIYLPLYLQLVHGSSPTESGLLLTPMMLGVVTSSVVSGRMISSMGRYKVFPIVGTALMTLGFWLFTNVGVTTSLWALSGYMVVVGLGIGMVMQVMVLAMQNSVEQRDMGVVTSSASFFRSLGGSFGTALFGAVLTSQLSAYLIGHGAPPSARDQFASLNTGAMSALKAQDPAGYHLMIGGFVHALHDVFLTAVPIGAAAFVLAWFLKEIRLRDRAHVGQDTVKGLPETSAEVLV